MHTVKLILLTSLLLVAACGSTTQSTYPIGIGRGPNSLKASPCACLQLPNDARMPGFTPPLG